MSDLDGRVPPAPGCKQLTPTQIQILDNTIGLIYALCKREGSAERIIITVKGGLPRTISHSLVRQKMAQTDEDLAGEGALQLKWLQREQLHEIDKVVHAACEASRGEGSWIEIPLEIVPGGISIGLPTISREFKPI